MGCNKNRNCFEEPSQNMCQPQPCGCDFEVDAGCVRVTRELPCTGTTIGQTLEEVLLSVDEKLCDITPQNCDCPVDVQVLKVDTVNFSTFLEINTLYTIPGATYTVPSSGAGTYDVMLNAYVQFFETGLTGIAVYVNGVQYEPTSAIGVNNTKTTIIPITLFVPNITLAVGDIITIKASVANLNNTLNNINYKLTKIS